MAFIKYSAEECQIASDVLSADPLNRQSRDSVSVSIGLSGIARARLSESLSEIMNREGSELRTEFPAGWTIFWKIRDGESRFFVAHPEADQWVATLALSKSHLDAIRLKLESEYEGPLSGLETVSRMSNVEVILRRAHA
jgi:hypothetical protein